MKNIIRKIIFLACCTIFSSQMLLAVIEAPQQPRILVVHVVSLWGGGGEINMGLYPYFLQQKYFMRMLVAKNSPHEKELQKLNLPYYTTCARGANYSKILFKDIMQICKKDKINIIQCNKDPEYPVIKKVAEQLPVKTIAYYHSHVVPNAKIFDGFSAFLAASPLVAQAIKDAVKTNGLNIGYINFVIPPHGEDRFLSFKPEDNVSREDFFEKNFSIKISNTQPLACVIANLLDYKNHELLLKAMHTLIYKLNSPMQTVFVGYGKLEQYLKSLSQQLKIQDYVHFLGFSKKVPDILFYSDFKILPSKEEAFGIVLLEAALMKKPIIATTGAALAGIFIQHEKTGLLCNPYDQQDLAQQIIRLIKDPLLSEQLGKNAYDLALKEYSNKAALEKFEKLYWNLIK